jgi:hypothetical protein
MTPADLAVRVHYDVLISSLYSRALRPDPGPPRPGTPS